MAKSQKVLVAVDIEREPEALLGAFRPWAGWLKATFDLGHASRYTVEEIQRDASPSLLWRLTHLDALRARELQRLKELQGMLPEEGRGEVRLLDGRPLDVLPEASEDYDLVVVGTHGRTGIARMVLGSVAERVLRLARSPVLVLRLHGAPVELPARPRVVVPMEPTGGPEALIHARKWLGDEVDLELVHILPVPWTGGDPLPQDVRDAISQARDRAVQSMKKIAADQGFPKAGIHVVTPEGAHPGDAIARFAEDKGAHAIVIPSHGRSGLQRVRLGSVAERVARVAPCAVLVIRREEE